MIKNVENLIKFTKYAGKLKTAYRFSQIKTMKGDSAADHSWRLSLMAFIIAEEVGLELDIFKAVRIALVHDLAESITGDVDYLLIAGGKITKEEKRKAEIKAIKQLCGCLPEKTAIEIKSLWEEYESSFSPEAKYIKALDKLETQLHLIEAGREHFDVPKIIATYADGSVKDFPQLKFMLKEIKNRLKMEFSKGKIAWKPEYNYGLSD